MVEQQCLNHLFCFRLILAPRFSRDSREITATSRIFEDRFRETTAILVIYGLTLLAEAEVGPRTK